MKKKKKDWCEEKKFLRIKFLEDSVSDLSLERSETT